MHQQADFKISHKLHAIDLSSYREHGRHSWEFEGQTLTSVWMEIDAVWYRRKNGVTYACIGNIHGSFRDYDAPAYAEDFLAALTDGRYGPTPEGRWDGENYWGAQKPETIQKHLTILRPMMADYPSAPASYSTWWRF